MRTLLGVALVVQGILGASLWLHGNPHSEGYVALAIAQSALVLAFLILLSLTRRDKTVKDSAFIGMAIGLPAIWRLIVWCGAAFIP